MAEILTESFCERCGTRYTFESPARRSNPLGALGTVGRGLRNFVVSPDQSIDEAFAVARAENEQKATAHQLEAFHRTFNFCLSCRQYTCGSCWNPVEGRCQSCAPMPEAEMLPAVEIEADAPVVAEAMAIARAAAVPVIELPPALEAPEPVATDEMIGPEVAAEVESGEPSPAEPELAERPQTEAGAETFASLAVEDLETAAAEALPEAKPAMEPVSGDAPEPGLDVEPEALAPIEEPEPVAAIEAEAEPVVPGEPEPEPVVPIEPEPEPEPVAQPGATATRRSSSLLAFPPGVSLDEEIAAYDLRVAALAGPPIAPPPPTVPPAPSAPEVAPAAPPETLRPAASQVTAQPALPPVYVAGAVPDLPAASPAALPAAQTTGVCASCGLSLSATARFCRRCGTPQHLD